MLGEKIPQPLIDVLQHIILSHHDRPEFGSPKTPATPEAIAVHTIENLDAKLMMSLGATRGDRGESAAGEGNWTEYMKAFGGRLYRPDVAPADVADAAEGADGTGEGAEEDRSAAASPPLSQVAPAVAGTATVAKAENNGHRRGEPPLRPTGAGGASGSPGAAASGASHAPQPPAAPLKLQITNPLFESAPGKRK